MLFRMRFPVTLPFVIIHTTEIMIRYLIFLIKKIIEISSIKFFKLYRFLMH